MADGLGRAFTTRRPALIAYLMAGYPERATSLAAIRAAVDAGADLIELGVPYGDPLADGRVIRDAGRTALASGWSLDDTFGLVHELDAGSVDRGSARAPAEIAVQRPPVALMTYYNPLLQYGLEAAARAARESGVDGFIIPDLPPDAADEWLAVSEGLDTVFLVAPTSTDERIRLVAERSRGFVYCVSSLGVTGERAVLSESLPELVDRVRDMTDAPVAVGFGIGTPEKAAEVASFADGVVVGSAIVALQEGPERVAGFVRSLAETL